MAILAPIGTDFGFFTSYVTSAMAAYPDLEAALEGNWLNLKQFVAGLTEEQLLLRYAPGKWSIKETMQHLVDAERNFCYRSMRISRNDQGILPMYDIHSFTINSGADSRSIEGIMEELETLRKASKMLFTSLSDEQLNRMGPARDALISVRSLGFALVGHAMHHVNLIRQKYILN